MNMGSGPLGGVSAMIAASWVEMVGAIVSGTLKNSGAEKMAPIRVAVQCW